MQREDFHVIQARLNEPRHLIQVLIGPRQVGKTTLALQVIDHLKQPCHYASADEIHLHQATWLEQQWETARSLITSSHREAILILDEIQKIKEWSTVVKRLWDEDSRQKRALKILLLGSGSLLIQKGISESLMGRFEVTAIRHWSFSEMQDAFGVSFEEYVYFGGYPGSTGLISDGPRWKRYVLDALIEPTLSKDILLMEPVQKPALLRQLFHLGCLYSGQILSYQKMTGQLKDAGNTTTLAHYLELLSGAGLLGGLFKYAGQIVRQRGSSPKFQVHNNALFSASSEYSFAEARENPEFWGRLLESAIGSHLINQVRGKNIELFYWREANQEVDFFLQSGSRLVAIEVKSGKARDSLPGMSAFSKQFSSARKLLVGGQGISPQQFLKTPIEKWFER